MAPKFGTSGLRGLVTELTPALVGDHVRAFLKSCPVGIGLYVGRDLRPSSPDIAGIIIDAARAAGVHVTDCGAVPTPALALAAMGAGASAVMVTGSHIPADRNGLKFYTPAGEITKAHEQAILGALGQSGKQGIIGVLARNPLVGGNYIARYVDAYGHEALKGCVVGVYSHSTVGRDVLMDVLRGLGAEVIELGRSEKFIPVDTEAVDAATRKQLRAWAAEHRMDAIMSMDGDGDRPLLTDASGQVIPGDVLGQITGASLGADIAVTPVSSNTGAESVFDQVVRTKIGSPYVIAGMESDMPARVVGYEANGGFLLGYAAAGLAPLMTRDSVLPLIAPLVAASNLGLAALVERQPKRFTAADRLQGISTEKTNAFIAELDTHPSELETFLAPMDSRPAQIDRTDGLRVTLQDGRIVHLRPSGNAPECRCYAEADSPEAAQETLSAGLQALMRALG